MSLMGPLLVALSGRSSTSIPPPIGDMLAIVDIIQMEFLEIIILGIPPSSACATRSTDRPSLATSFVHNPH